MEVGVWRDVRVVGVGDVVRVFFARVLVAVWHVLSVRSVSRLGE